MKAQGFRTFVRRMRVALIVLAVSALSMPMAWAMRVSPMVSELTTSGPGATARIEVGNVGSASLPFETVITRLDIDPDGNMIETPADENFLVFPPQGLVPVNGRQVVRLQWVGAPDLPASQAYYLWVKQLPVATDAARPDAGGSVAVSVLYTMKALVVVAPPNAQPDVKVISATPKLIAPPAPTIDPSLAGTAQPPAPAAETPGLEVVITNQGRRYALMSGATWNIEGITVDGQPFVKSIPGQEIASTVGVGYVAPLGGKRTFQLPIGVSLDPAQPITVRFTR